MQISHPDVLNSIREINPESTESLTIQAIEAMLQFHFSFRHGWLLCGEYRIPNDSGEDGFADFLLRYRRNSVEKSLCVVECKRAEHETNAADFRAALTQLNKRAIGLKFGPPQEQIVWYVGGGALRLVLRIWHQSRKMVQLGVYGDTGGSATTF